MSESYSFTRYLRLHTLHAVEQTAMHQRVLQARITTVQYVMRQLPTKLDGEWHADANQGIALTRDFTAARIHGLLGNEMHWKQLLEDTAASWRPYQALRQQSTIPVLSSASRAGFAKRLAQAERLLYLTKTAIEVANMGLDLWERWRRFRDERSLLQESVAALVAGQEQALDQALTPGYVQHYLQHRGDDPAYDIVFED